MAAFREGHRILRKEKETAAVNVIEELKQLIDDPELGVSTEFLKRLLAFIEAILDSRS